MKGLFERQPRTLALYHAIGEQMHELEEDEAHTRYGSRWRKVVAASVEESDATLTKCLQFFDTYKSDEIAELDGLGVGWVGLIIALGVRDKKKRHRLLRQARDEGWGQRELRREARRLKGSNRGGGRPRKEERSRGCLADAVELAKLALPELVLDTLRRLVERQCMQREHRSIEPVGLGPIIVSVDESGSMQGDKAHTAKALALAMAWVARSQKRWCALVAYSGDSGERLLPSLRAAGTRPRWPTGSARSSAAAVRSTCPCARCRATTPS
jgi:hypothetical protein